MEQGERVWLLQKQDGCEWMVGEEKVGVREREKEPGVGLVLPSSRLRESNLQRSRRVSWRATTLGKVLV